MFASRSSVILTAAALVLAAGGWARAQSATTVRPPLLPADAYRPAHSATHPDWVDESLEPTSHAHITRITEGTADVALLDGGLYQGFRNGVKCVIQRQGATVASLVVVACQENRAAALITERENIIIVPGDEVRVSSMSLQ
jgi:predicted alpha/beta-hydrolase family hydrolase